MSTIIDCNITPLPVHTPTTCPHTPLQWDLYQWSVEETPGITCIWQASCWPPWKLSHLVLAKSSRTRSKAELLPEGTEKILFYFCLCRSIAVYQNISPPALGKEGVCHEKFLAFVPLPRKVNVHCFCLGSNWRRGVFTWLLFAGASLELSFQRPISVTARSKPTTCQPPETKQTQIPISCSD